VIDQRLLPGNDFATRALPTVSIPAGAGWARIHGSTKRPLWFGPAPGEPPQSRFDDPLGTYRVCYIGQTLEAAFSEVFLRDLRVRLLPRAAFETRSLSHVTTLRAVSLIQFHGAGLARLGTTAAIEHGPYQLSRAWARACWDHAGQHDGLSYRPRHDDDQLAVALFERAADAVAAVGAPFLVSRLPELPELLRRYDIGVVD
jgi:hypothetical protein